ncbi:MAG: lipase [Rhizobiaceae bacterium]
MDLQALPAAAGRGDVYLLRGFADVFSRGLDEMGTELNHLGVSAHVQGHLTWRSVARQIIADTKQNGRVPVVLVGHSLGANAVISIAERLAREGIAVDYMATFAATAPDPVPGNVRRVVNYYFATNGWGEPLVPGPGFAGSLRNRDFSASATIGHFNIEKQRPLQAEVLREVLRTLGR